MPRGVQNGAAPEAEWSAAQSASGASTFLRRQESSPGFPPPPRPKGPTSLSTINGATTPQRGAFAEQTSLPRRFMIFRWAVPTLHLGLETVHGCVHTRMGKETEIDAASLERVGEMQAVGRAADKMGIQELPLVVDQGYLGA